MPQRTANYCRAGGRRQFATGSLVAPAVAVAESVAVNFGVRIVIDPDGYRPNVGIVLMHPDGRVFWARRVRRDGWQFPQGGMNTDETPLEAMYRELREETGLLPEHVAVLGATPGWLRYRLPPRRDPPQRPHGLHRPEAGLVPAAVHRRAKATCAWT